MPRLLQRDAPGQQQTQQHQPPQQIQQQQPPQQIQQQQPPQQQQQPPQQIQQHPAPQPLPAACPVSGAPGTYRNSVTDPDLHAKFGRQVANKEIFPVGLKTELSTKKKKTDLFNLWLEQDQDMQR
eukprot:769678-Pyramimonas_sp.AAC.1